MKMSVQQKIVAIPLVVMCLVSISSFIAIEVHLKSLLEQRIEQELTWLSNAAAEALNSNSEEVGVDFYDDLADRLALAGAARISFIDAEGTLLGDSALSKRRVARSDKLSNRPEFISAMADGRGKAVHFSDATQEDYLYVAVRIEHTVITEDDDYSYLVVARASQPMAEIQSSVNEFRLSLLPIGVATLLVYVVLGTLGTRLLARQVQKDKEKLEERVDERTRKVELLQTMSGLLNSCTSLEDASIVLQKVMPVLIPQTSGAVSIIKSSRNRLDLVMNWGASWPGTEHFLPSECWSMRKGHQHVSCKGDLDIYCDHWQQQPKQHSICTPLLAQGETVGVLHLLKDTDKTVLDEGMYSAVAEQIGLTLANIMLRDNLREQAIRDPLTGLYNRRYMTDALHQACSRAKRYNKPLTVMMLDLDHFKRFNDDFGHNAGDYVLKNVASVIKRELRHEDIPCRYGGEEIALVCPDLSAEFMLQVAKRIQDGIRELELKMNDMELGAVTISIGLALMADHGETGEELIEAADQALYRAKAFGRDCIVVSGSNEKVNLKNLSLELAKPVGKSSSAA